MKIQFLFLLVLFNQHLPAEVNNVNRVNKDSIQLDTITYTQTGFNYGVELLLISNHTFIQKEYGFDCVSTTIWTYTTGKYNQKQNKITLIPKMEKSIVQNDQLPQKDTIFYSKPNMAFTQFFQLQLKDINYLIPNFPKEYIESSPRIYQYIERPELRFQTKDKPKQIYFVKDLPNPLQSIFEFNRVYKIQLGAFKNINSFKPDKVADLGSISYLKKEDITFVLLGDFKTYKKAKAMEAFIKKRGLEAVVVAIQDGKKVPLK